MQSLSVDCPGYGRLRFLGNQLYQGHDRLLQSNADGLPVDRLFLLDSRGVSGQFDGSLAQRLIEDAVARRLRYLMICRPLDLTTWASVVNFSELNDVRPGKLVTNAGFVDFTPKKPEVLADAMAQVAACAGRDAASTVFLEQSTRVTGERIDLYGMRYTDAYGRRIATTVRAQPTVVINSPLVLRSCLFARPRPASFFSALEDSNAFNRQFAEAQVVDLPDFDVSHTYDGVHYTAQGSQLIFERLKDYL